MMPSAEVRPARPEDIEDIARLEAQCFSHPWTREQLADSAKLPHKRLLSALADGRLVGYIALEVVADCACVDTFAVDTRFRGRGFGQALLEKAIKAVRKEGCTVFTLEVRKSNIIAHGLYKKLGFADAGIRRGFYRDPDEDGITMSLQIDKAIG